MLIKVNRKSFAAACGLAGRFTGGNNVKPILKSIKLACNGSAEMSATDLEMGVRLNTDATIEESGEALLPTERVNKILASMEDDEITLKADADEISLTGASAEFHIPFEEVSSFPDVPIFGDGESITIASGILKNLIDKTSFAAATTTKHSATCGVVVECDGAELTMVGTNGRRMSICHGHGVGPITRADSPIVPVKVLKLLESRLMDDDAPVRIKFGVNDVMVDANGATVYSRLVEGRFPKYRSLIPDKLTHVIKLEAGTFSSAVCQARCMTSDESKRVVFNLAKSKLVLSAQGASSGRARVELPIEFDGKCEISFDPQYVIDLVSRLKADEQITLEINKPSDPAVIRHGVGQIYILVPLVEKKGE